MNPNVNYNPYQYMNPSTFSNKKRNRKKEQLENLDVKMDEMVSENSSNEMIVEDSNIMNEEKQAKPQQKR
jgi:hypothetical protein